MRSAGGLPFIRKHSERERNHPADGRDVRSPELVLRHRRAKGQREQYVLHPLQGAWKFYFKFTEGSETNFICASGQKNPAYHGNAAGQAWLASAYVQGKVEQDTIELEIAGFTGISMGTAYNVPTMLFPGSGGFYFHDMKDAEVIRTEDLSER